MLAIDLIGVLLTIAVVGIRYPHYVVVAGLINELGILLMAFITNGNIKFILAAGAFSMTTVAQDDWHYNVLLLLSGPLANYIFCAVVGDIHQETASNLINPGVRLDNPFAVVNLRFAVLSILSNLWFF